MIRVIGTACAVLLVLSAVLVASPETAMAGGNAKGKSSAHTKLRKKQKKSKHRRNKRQKDHCSPSNGNDDSDVVLAPIDSPAPPKTQEDIAAEKDKRRANIKCICSMIENLEGRWALLQKLLKTGRLSDLAKELERPDPADMTEDEWKMAVKEWWESLTKEQQQVWTNAINRENEIRGLIRDLRNKETYKKRKENLDDSKVKAEVDLKEHCERYPLQTGEF